MLFVRKWAHYGSLIFAARFPRIAPISYKMTIKINKGIPYKMKENPAKFSNCILRLLYDSDFMRKSSILLLLQCGKVFRPAAYKMASELGLFPTHDLELDQKSLASRQRSPIPEDKSWSETDWSISVQAARKFVLIESSHI